MTQSSVALSIPELIQKKRDGERLSAETIRLFVSGAVSGDMQDCQIGESASKHLSFSFCLPLSRCRRGAATKCRDVVLGAGAGRWIPPLAGGPVAP